MTETIIEILIDNSGSMGHMTRVPENKGNYLIDGETRMTLIKKILVEQIIPSINKYTNQIFIRTFRGQSIMDKGKQIGDLEISLIYKGEFDNLQVLQKINSLKDPGSGGTPITSALNIAINNLERFPNSDRKIILLTDGEENGGGNYLTAANRAKLLKGLQCKIFIVGLALDEASEEKAISIATGGYYNIKSKSFSLNEVEKILTPLKIDVMEDTIKNLQIITSKPVKEKIEELLSSNINSTTLTIDEDYSEEIRKKSEEFLYKYLCEKYGEAFVNWLNKYSEIYESHDFEITDNNQKVILIIECKGTSREKPTFYLTSKEWSYFLENKHNYQIYRVFNVDSKMNIFCIDNLLESILNEQVVPYLYVPEILKEERVFLTLKK